MHRETGVRTLADAVIGDELGRNERLERIHDLLDWDRLGAVVSELHSSRFGRRAYPPLMMLKTLLLQHLHDMGDPQLEQRLRNDLSWRRFVGLGLEDGTPDHSTISRFRKLLVEKGLMRDVFDAVNRQLDEKGLVMREGTVIDATIVQAQPRRPRYRTDDEGERIRSKVDPDADWGRGGCFGYKGHLAVDRDSLLVRDALVTPANVGDVQMFEALVQGDEKVVYADAAYESRRHTELLEHMGVENAVMHRGNKHHPLPEIKLARNRKISKLRMPAEGVFGYLKRSLGYSRVRYIGLMKGEAELLLKSTVYNIVRSLNIEPAHSKS